MKNFECNGYIKEIEELNQEIFRLKGFLRLEREVEVYYIIFYIMFLKGVIVIREVVVLQEFIQIEFFLFIFGYIEFMVDVKEKIRFIEIFNYEMSFK